MSFNLSNSYPILTCNLSNEVFASYCFSYLYRHNNVTIYCMMYKDMYIIITLQKHRYYLNNSDRALTVIFKA